MKAILALTFDQLRNRRKGGIVMLALVATLASAAVVAGASVLGNSGDRIDEVHMSSGQPDLFVVGSDPDLFHRALSGQPEVVAIGTPSSGARVTIATSGNQGVSTRLGALDDPSSAGVGSPQLRSGRWVSGPDEIVVDAAWASSFGVSVGATVTVELNGKPTDMVAVGTAVDLGDCFYPNCTPVPGWVTSATLVSLKPDNVVTSGFATLAPGADDEAVASRIVNTNPGIHVGSWTDTRGDLLVTSQISSYFVSGLGVFVMVASALVVASTAVTAVVSRRRDFALLKTMGSTPGQIAAAILVEHLIVAAPAVFVGWVAGSFIAPSLEIGLVGPLGRSGVRLDPFLLVIALTIVLGILAMATVVPAARAGRDPIVEAIRNPPSRSGARLQRLIDQMPGSANTVLGTRLALARPARVLLASAALALAATSVYASWNLSRTVDQIFGDAALAGDPWDITIEPRSMSEAPDVDSVLRAEIGVDGWYRERQTSVIFDDDQVTTFVVASGSQVPGHVLLEGAKASPGQATAAHGFLEQYDHKIGDVITFEFADRSLDVELAGRHSDAEDLGVVLMVPIETFREAGIEVTLPLWRVVVADGVDPFDVKAGLQQRLPDGASVMVLEPDVAGPGFVTAVLIILTVIIVTVAAGNLAATMASTVRERQRRTGVLRALGLDSRQLLAQAGVAGAVVGVVAAVVGIPLGFVVSKAMLAAIMDLVGIGAGVATVPVVVPALVIAPICVAVGAVVGIGAAAPSMRTAAVELLRAD
ncbi:MAG: FtsX-like permease family protein [Actinomycetia bacterium]|nr:FtsX-like permease family protein [Actinomycetes bacterium]